MGAMIFQTSVRKICESQNGNHLPQIIRGEHKTHTPGKIYMEPDNTALEQEKHLPNHNFQVLCESWGVYLKLAPRSSSNINHHSSIIIHQSSFMVMIMISIINFNFIIIIIIIIIYTPHKSHSPEDGLGLVLHKIL